MLYDLKAIQRSTCLGIAYSIFMCCHWASEQQYQTSGLMEGAHENHGVHTRQAEDQRCAHGTAQERRPAAGLPGCPPGLYHTHSPSRSVASVTWPLAAHAPERCICMPARLACDLHVGTPMIGVIFSFEEGFPGVMVQVQREHPRVACMGMSPINLSLGRGRL